MNLFNYKENKEGLLKKLIERINEIEQRERIVIKFPFGSKFTRVEIYCSEALVIDKVGYFGEKFNGVVSLQVYNDYTNKHIEKSTYSYKNDFIKYIPTLVDKLYKAAFEEAATA